MCTVAKSSTLAVAQTATVDMFYFFSVVAPSFSCLFQSHRTSTAGFAAKTVHFPFLFCPGWTRPKRNWMQVDKL